MSQPPAPTDRPRRATPRPLYDHPTVIAHERAAVHLWGDPASGFVSDKVYVSTDVLHVLQFTLPPGGRFVHSATNPTVFAADVTYSVLEGDLWAADPQHGEVRRIMKGQTLFYRKDTWHHAFNPSSDPVRVLEYFAPPPSLGTASTYAKQQPMLEGATYDDTRWDRTWPASSGERAAATRLQVLDEADFRWRLVDDRAQHVQGVIVDTDHLTVARGRVSPGHLSAELDVMDETVLYLTDGSLNVLLPDAPEGEQAWFPLAPHDAVFLTAGSTYRIADLEGKGASYWLGSGRPVADGWQP